MSEDELYDTDLTKRPKRPICGEYKAGRKVDCWVRAKAFGGYIVSVGLNQDPGFLSTQRDVIIESWITVEFVCVSNWRILLSDRFL